VADKRTKRGLDGKWGNNEKKVRVSLRSLKYRVLSSNRVESGIRALALTVIPKR
jgi:hypothetical protein